MKLSRILKDECFKNANVLSKHKVLNQEVLSVMILEATDIEKWGKENQLILTSYYALIEFNDKELYTFFVKMSTIGIKGLILKVDRLLTQAPKRLIEYCNVFDIPLIQVPQDVKYEKIVLAVLEPIINENSQILTAYYEARKTINKLSLKELSLSQLIKSLKNLLDSDIQIHSEDRTTYYTTFKNDPDFQILNRKPLPKMKFVNKPFSFVTLKYSDGATIDAISIDIPNVLDSQYTFIVFDNFQTLNKKEIMLIETASELILKELLKIYAVKKSQSMRKNNLMHDLLLGRYYSEDEKQSILNLLNIGQGPFYQGIIVSLYGINLRAKHPVQSPLDAAINFMISKFGNIAYFQKNYDIIFLYNFKNKDQSIKENDIKNLLKIYEEKNKNLTCHIGISTVQTTSFKTINTDLLNLKNFMKTLHEHSHVLEYDNLGFFKMFQSIENIEELYSYVPENMLKLAKDKPEYALTFSRFLSNNQNYVKTANELFVHPKTVRYRINKIVEGLNVSLDDTDRLLSLQIGLMICEYTKLITLENRA